MHKFSANSSTTASDNDPATARYVQHKIHNALSRAAGGWSKIKPAMNLNVSRIPRCR